MALIASYKLNGNGNDALWANNLTDTNVTWVNWKMNQWGSFNGSNSTCRTNNTLGINWSAYSVTCLVKLNVENNSWIWAIFAQCNTSTLVTNYIYYNYNWWSRQLVFGRTRNIVADDIIVHSITLWTNNWYHLSITYDWSNVKWYINWVFIWQVMSVWNGIGWWSNWFDIWAWNWWTVFFANAIIDELEVHNTALTQTEVTNNFLYYNWYF